MKAQLLRIGTRGSKLALTQSQWVAQLLKSSFPKIQTELVVIRTKGDDFLSAPLQELPGKDFFVAELDAALLESKVDCTVHSLKDMSLTRPSQIVLAAIPEREDPRDILFLNTNFLEKIKQSEPLCIGTSAPRRKELLPSFLSWALPQLGDTSPQVQIQVLRGNVTTRLDQLRSGVLDGVVLALAGVSRLCIDQEFRQGLKDFRWMLLPLSEVPGAPGQGALAVECLRESSSVLGLLRGSLHHVPTAKAVGFERQLLRQHGGGCHQAWGATQIQHTELGALTRVKGKAPDLSPLFELIWQGPQLCLGEKKPKEYQIFDGTSHKAPVISYAKNLDLKGHRAILVTHQRAMHCLNPPQESVVITAGLSTWRKLAQKGIFVGASAESLGFHSLIPVLENPVFDLGERSSWVALTHQEALESWKEEGIKALATYALGAMQSPQIQAQIESSSYGYWASASQFKELGGFAPEGMIHCCGPGKTAQTLKDSGLSPIVFPNRDHFLNWLSKSIAQVDSKKNIPFMQSS